MSIEIPPGRLLKAHQVADRLGVDRRRVYELPIPRIHLSSKCIRWDEVDVIDFIRSRRTP